MKLQNILKEELNLIKLKDDELAHLEKETRDFIFLLKEEIKKKKINADVFIGGSFAKGTLLKREKCDIDILVRFDLKIENISEILKNIVSDIPIKEGFFKKIVHGSRDYFQICGEDLIFELIPVYQIKKPKEARNVTDLTYFHVNYLNRKTNNFLKEEILLAKQFCYAQKIYGAESYIQGFSGYGLECLIIHYKSFLKMLKELSRADKQIIIDIERYYKKKGEISLNLNESRIQGPIILIDPTWKERNVLAALSKENFEKLQKAGREFLKNPSMTFFKLEEFNKENFIGLARENKAEFMHVEIKTDRQEGDIAGTKMKKFARFLEKKLSRFFDILKSEFIYQKNKISDMYVVVKSKKEIIIAGPPVKMKSAADAFRKCHKNIFEKNKVLYLKEKIDFSASQFLKEFSRKENKTMKDMGITEIKIN